MEDDLSERTRAFGAKLIAHKFQMNCHFIGYCLLDTLKGTSKNASFSPAYNPLFLSSTFSQLQRGGEPGPYFLKLVRLYALCNLLLRSCAEYQDGVGP